LLWIRNNRSWNWYVDCFIFLFSNTDFSFFVLAQTKNGPSRHSWKHTCSAFQNCSSTVFSPAPVTGSQPPSIISDSGTDVIPPRKEQINSSETPQPVSARIAAVGKSAHVSVNTNTSASSSKVRPSVEGAMGLLPLKPRPSLIGTPTPTGRDPHLRKGRWL